MISAKENYLRSFMHEKTAFVPSAQRDCAILGFGGEVGPWIEKGPAGGGYDGFGVRWVTPESGNDAPIPAPNEFVLEDICDWKNVKFPDLAAYDWEGHAKADLAGVDRNEKLVEFGCGNGIFERLAALMGFENALISLIEEPEACDDFFKKLTDYKIDFASQVKKYYNADIFNNYEDIATERGLFMSPDCYRELLKPHHKRLYDAVKDMGMLVTQHTCGYAEPLVEDFIEIGVDQWSSVQVSNDIAGMIQKYGDRITFSGGFDSNGPVATENATDEMIREEIRRCIDEYGCYHQGYVFFGFFLCSDPVLRGKKFQTLFGELLPYRMKNAIEL
ncbi:MAG: uroporphyrinogen decarboxylase family protein [Lachnospiraceae bacterium]